MGVCNCNITNTISAHITSEFLMPISDKNSNDIKNQISESSIQTKPVSLIQSPRGKEITKIQRKTTKKLIKVTKISRKASITGFLAQIAASIANQPISCTALVQSYKNKFTKPVRKTNYNRRRTFSSFTRKYNTIIPTEKSNKNLPNAELISSNAKNQFKDNLNEILTINVNEVKANENNSKDILKIGSSLIRSKSFLNQDPSLRLSPKSQINEDEEEVSNLNKLNDKLNYCLSLRELTNEEEISIRTTLSNNTAFFGLNDKHIKLMSDCFNLYELNNDVCIFKEKEDSNHFFLIASGKVELKTNNEVKILTREDSFGEISFFNATKKKRTYSAYTLSKVQIFSFCVEDFKNTLKTKGEDFQEIFFKNELLKEKYRNDFYNFYLFQYLPLDIKEQLFSLSKIIILNQSNTLLVSSFSSLKKSSFVQTKKPFLNHPKHLIFPMEGSNSLIEKFQQSNQHKRIQKGNVAGLIYTFFKSNIVFEYEVYTCSNSCICLVLSDEMLRECIGVDYSKEILFSFFKNKIKLSTELIPYLIAKSYSDKKENEDSIYRKLFNDFSIEEYKINDTIVSKSVTCDKYVLTLNEDIFNQRSSQIFTSKGNFYGEEIINHHQFIDFDIIAKKHQTVTFECNWINIKQTLTNLHHKIQKLFELRESLSKLTMLSELSEKEIFEFSVNIKKEKFKKGETIIQIGTSNTKFYFILKGRVKLKEPKHKTTIRVYDQGNCFGEYSILYDKPNELNIVASENVICYTISKEAFLELLSNQKANDYMKEKMLLESYELKLKDLFYISYLGKGKFGNVYLVHNTMSFYAVKVISKTSVEKIKGGVQCLINEKKTMLKLDHPFIVKLVKTTKKEGLVFILQEYIKGINFEDYLQGRKNKHNLYEIKFYGACIFEMIGYLNRNKIVHRDIKPSNIMLESRGYLKLIDFGTARKLKNFTHTLIGTPNFIAPEILMGNGYSFSCDFWSIGIIIFYIYFGYLPFGSKAEDLNDIYNDIIQREPEYPADTPFELKLILQNLLNKHPMQRITSIEGIKKESLFTDFPWDDLLKFKIKPPFIPLKDHRDSIDNLNNCNTTFEMIIESDKLDILQTKSLRNGSSSPKNFRRSSINSCWFNDF